MTPLDVKPKEEWEKVLDTFSRDARMTACLTDSGGNLIFCRMDRYPLCAAVRGNTEATTFICSQTNAAMLAVVKQTLAPEIDFCEAGLLRVAVPIVREGAVVGQVAACGLASEDEEIETLLVTKQLGIPEERLEDMIRSTPVGREQDLRTLAQRLFTELNPM